MPKPTARPEWIAFVSHASEDDRVATRISNNLVKNRVSVWIDHENLRRRGLLLEALQTAIEACQNVVVLWSTNSALSRYVTAEWNFAWNRQRSIIPCRLDQTALPLGLAGGLYCDFRASFNEGAKQLREALQEPPSLPAPAGKPAAAAPSAKLVQKNSAFRSIYAQQNSLLNALGRGDLARANTIQLKLNPIVSSAQRQFPRDAGILGLSGYHLKNAYQIKHWSAIQARRSPDDPLLAKSEARFWEALKCRPDDPSALNGLGSILWLRGDLDAAEFYVQRSIERAHQEGFSYPYAEEDLRNIRREKALRAKAGANPPPA